MDLAQSLRPAGSLDVLRDNLARLLTLRSRIPPNKKKKRSGKEMHH
jgi:hypothetical protein